MHNFQLVPKQDDFPEELLRGDDYDYQRVVAYLQAFNKPLQSGPYGLLSVGKDVKTVKGEKYGIRTGVLYLAPAQLSGHELCQGRTKGCTAACLWTAGHGAYHNVQTSRLRKTMVFLYRQDFFMESLDRDIATLRRDAESKGMQPAVRLNGTSDINWVGIAVPGSELLNIFEQHSDVKFYDYTKRLEILEAASDIENYHLTFSRAETKKNQADCEIALKMGYNITVVFRKTLPATYLGYPVIDGDRHDVRFWDVMKAGGGPVVIGLKAKGRARNDFTSGFVV